MTRKLSEDENLKLIQLYRQNQCLWDIRSKYHRNKQVRLAALENIKRDLNIKGMDIQDIRRKIKILRATYYLEVDKIEKSKRSGGRIYVPKIIWFDELHSFIKNMTVKRRISKGNKRHVDNDLADLYANNIDQCGVTFIKIEASSPTHDEPDISDQTPEMENYNIEALDDTLNHEDDAVPQVDIDNSRDYETTSWIEYKPPIALSPEVISQAYYVDCSHINKPRSKRRKVSQIAAVIKDVKSVKCEVKSDHETDLDVFGKHVASQLKKLSVEQVVIAQEQIQNVLCKRRLADIRAKNKLKNVYTNEKIF